MNSAELQTQLDGVNTRLTELADREEGQSYDSAEVLRLDAEKTTLEASLREALNSERAARILERHQATAEIAQGSETTTAFDLASFVLEHGERELEAGISLDVDLLMDEVAFDASRPANVPSESGARGRTDIFAAAPTSFMDIIPSRPTTDQLVQYTEITYNSSNRADVTAEGVAKTAGDFTTALKTAQVQDIVALAPATNQLLRDIREARAIIQGALRADVRQKVDRMVVGRTNTDQEFVATKSLWGISGVQAKSTEAVGDKVAKEFMQLMTQVESNGYGEMPNYVALAGAQWGNLVASTGDTDNDYIFDGRDRRFNGSRVLFTPVLDSAKKQMVSGDFRAVNIELRPRTRPTLTVGRMNDDMAKRQIHMMVEMEVALTIYIPQRFALYKDSADATAWV